MGRVKSIRAAVAGALRDDPAASASIRDDVLEATGDRRDDGVRAAAVAALGVVGDARDAARLVRAMSDFHDAVRVAATRALVQNDARGIPPPISAFAPAIQLASDAAWQARLAAAALLHALSWRYPAHFVAIGTSLSDSAFQRMSALALDPVEDVRVLAFRLMGAFPRGSVSRRLLLQTLSKVPLRDLRDHRGELRVAFNIETEVESATADDGHTAGAFVHGLEDEFKRVRLAAIDSIVALCGFDREFADNAVDFLVDMLNDEVRAVRVRAIAAVRRLALAGVVLTTLQLETVLGNLVELSTARETLSLIAALRLVGVSQLQAALVALLKCDIDDDVRATLRAVAIRHRELAQSLVKLWQSANPFVFNSRQAIPSPAYSAFMLFFRCAQPGDLPKGFVHQLEHCGVHTPVSRNSFRWQCPREINVVAREVLTLCSQRRYKAAADAVAENLCPRLRAEQCPSALFDLCNLYAEWLQCTCVCLVNADDFVASNLSYRVARAMADAFLGLTSAQRCSIQRALKTSAILAQNEQGDREIPQWWPGELPSSIKRIKFEIVEPRSDPEKPIRARPHSPAVVHLTAVLHFLPNLERLRISLEFVDGSVHLVRPAPEDIVFEGPGRHRLRCVVRVPHDISRRRQQQVAELGLVLVNDDGLALGLDSFGPRVKLYLLGT